MSSRKTPLIRRVTHLVQSGHGRERPTCPGCEHVVHHYERKIYIRKVAWHRDCALKPPR